MPEDILEKLRSKEAQMEALLSETRAKASIIKEAAVKKAKELKTAKIIELEEDLRKAYEKQDALVKSEAAAIDGQAEKMALELKEKGVRNMDWAVEKVYRIIAGAEGGPK